MAKTETFLCSEICSILVLFVLSNPVTGYFIGGSIGGTSSGSLGIACCGLSARASGSAQGPNAQGRSPTYNNGK
ncbi:hypothetical protein AVEN_142801-1 [Araneus ventricosus]|uniref:Uncharacterized protein n=1 Tax=Araneus ventricosus TaxID=182803 RepID=A0A4Y2L2B6_ARAVE|nr:hypothetical protein AVEN_142801-1 [Araneus ventricosus]